jgi:hypothetical protein
MNEADDPLLDDRLGRIRGKLDRLRAINFWRALLRGQRYREHPPLGQAGIASLESAYAVALPDELRTFLERVHGGGPGPGCDGLSINIPAVPRVRAARPFPYGSGDAQDLLARRRIQRYATLPLFEPEFGDDDDWPAGPGFIPLAHHGCGMFSVLVVTGAQRGRMWFCDMGWVPEHSEKGQLGFLDWYEDWLNRILPSKT